MKKEQYARVEAVMLQSMQKSVHDTGHVYRVLWQALDLATAEKNVNYDVLIISCLLHDIGRVEEHRSPKVGHAALGADMARDILRKQGWGEPTVAHVQACIRTHSYKNGAAPETLEAKLLFDADKLDLSGAVGTARALLFGAEIEEPFYLVGEDGLPTKGEKTEGPSLFREYNRKLKNLHKRFFTQKARKIAKNRQETMDRWFKSFKKEIINEYKMGNALLQGLLEG